MFEEGDVIEHRLYTSIDYDFSSQILSEESSLKTTSFRDVWVQVEEKVQWRNSERSGTREKRVSDSINHDERGETLYSEIESRKELRVFPALGREDIGENQSVWEITYNLPKYRTMKNKW